MRETLEKWTHSADALYHGKRINPSKFSEQMEIVRHRGDDLYIALIGELFDRMRGSDGKQNPNQWLRLGNAIAQAGGVGQDQQPVCGGILATDAAIFAAAAYYIGGFSASAYLMFRSINSENFSDTQRACYELMARPRRREIRSESVLALVRAVRKGNLAEIQRQKELAAEATKHALRIGPEEWVGCRIFEHMLAKFAESNIRAVLPEGESSFWNPLVESFLNRSPPVWDLFPSQIAAIGKGLLDDGRAFSLQMPTGAGKTALSELLLFHHLESCQENVAVLLVPYRALAAELRDGLVENLVRMGFPARSVYGGTVPRGDEVWDVKKARAIVATPEALSGLLTADQEFFSRISLVVCDEGHLLDSRSRGMGLEMLLTRMRTRKPSSPRIVFVSAIVPNVGEINEWLGGSQKTVVRSNYRPALPEFGVLYERRDEKRRKFDLHVQPQNTKPDFSLEEFLTDSDFKYIKKSTGRVNTYSYHTVKTRAIATARKSLSMGTVAVFSANKRGPRGAVGLAKELLNQLSTRVQLPTPLNFDGNRKQRKSKLRDVVEYYSCEYGSSWIGTRALKAGAVLHHGDIPQESREVIESLIRSGVIRLAICTNTLAEGVNLPIRTLVLYSVRRLAPDGNPVDLLVRDIKNLSGRTGRAGATTRGLVICADQNQWTLVERVARQEHGEHMHGELFSLFHSVSSKASAGEKYRTNEDLESDGAVHSLIDGIDTALIDLVTEDMERKELARLAVKLAQETFAGFQAKREPETRKLIKRVFRLRANRVSAIEESGRLNWLRETGAKARMLDTVVKNLLPARQRWDDFDVSSDPELSRVLLAWAWKFTDLRSTISSVIPKDAFRRTDFLNILVGWIDGVPLASLAEEIDALAEETDSRMNNLLGLLSRAVGFSFLTSVEQGVSLLGKVLEARGEELSQAVVNYPDHLRFGVPNSAARILAMGGLRHRRAAVGLGQSPELKELSESQEVFREAKKLVRDRATWISELGKLVFENTIEDLNRIGQRGVS